MKKASPNRSSKRSPKARVKKFCKDVCLLDQLYIRDDKMTISDLIKRRRQDHRFEPIIRGPLRADSARRGISALFAPAGIPAFALEYPPASR